MKTPRPKVAGLGFFEGESEEREQRLIRVEDLPIHPIDAHTLRNKVDELPKLRFGLLTVVDVGRRSIPFGDDSLIVLDRYGTKSKPAILAILSPQPCFLLEGLSSSQSRAPFLHPAVVRVKNLDPPPAQSFFQ